MYYWLVEGSQLILKFLRSNLKRQNSVVCYMTDDVMNITFAHFAPRAVKSGRYASYWNTVHCILMQALPPSKIYFTILLQKISPKTKSTKFRNFCSVMKSKDLSLFYLSWRCHYCISCTTSPLTLVSLTLVSVSVHSPAGFIRRHPLINMAVSINTISLNLLLLIFSNMIVFPISSTKGSLELGESEFDEK